MWLSLIHISDVKLLPGDGKGTYTRVAVTVTNTGKCEGEEVVQLYVRDEVASITRPIKELKGFLPLQDDSKYKTLVPYYICLLYTSRQFIPTIRICI